MDAAGKGSRASLTEMADFSQQDVVIEIDANRAPNRNRNFRIQPQSASGDIDHAGGNEFVRHAGGAAEYG